MPETIARVAFDYNAVPEKETRAKLRRLAVSGKEILRKTAQGVWEMGGVLNGAKDLLPHGEFMQWVAAEFGLSYRSAVNFMHVHEAFKVANFATLEAPISVLYELAAPSLDEETRTVASELLASGDIKTVADAKAIVAAGKPPKPAPLNGKAAAPAKAKPEPETDGYGRPLEAPEAKAAVTVAERAAEAKVEHDSLPPPAPAEPVEADLTPEEWLDTLPLWKVLRRMPHRGVTFRAEALAWRALAEPLKSMERQVVRAYPRVDTQLAPTGPLHHALMQAARTPHPREWGLCAKCDGRTIPAGTTGTCQCQHGYLLRDGKRVQQ